MVRFLINRPIAVSMTFIAILVLGVFAMNYIPVSLMPDIDIPEITVQVSESNTSARELENTVVQPIRRQLMQVGHLADITSETRNETSVIHLQFDYGTNVDFAFIEVNEKIDRAMNYLPASIERPRVIKANATDIPVFYLNLTVRNSGLLVADPNTKEPAPTTETTETIGTKRTTAASPTTATSFLHPLNTPDNDLFPVSQKFVELSRFASNVIRKRIEQLPEVAMVDMSGMVSSELLILPDNHKLESLGITLETLKNIIEKNNIKLGNLLIRDGQYQYSVRFSSTLQNKKDIENVYFRVNDRLLQLKDVASVIEHPQKQKGKVLANGADAVTIAVIKQSDAQMSELKEKLNSLIGEFEKDYPDIRFEVTRNQTQLLDYSIANLEQNLVWGAILAFAVMFLFLKEFRAPMLIGITIPTSLIISMLMFYAFHISINIVSLSGIILGVGMMVDNSIIVIDNITQHRQRLTNLRFQVSGSNEKAPAPNTETTEPKELPILESACVSGTNEVFRPMLSSVLTTCAVFIPLIFISGISGALFYDQAMAVTIGLLVSLAVSVTLLPVYYRIVYQKSEPEKENRYLKRLNFIHFEAIYMKGFRLIMRKQVFAFTLVFLFLVGSITLYRHLDKTRLPVITKTEVLLKIDWNEHIHIDENKKRVEQLVASLGKSVVQNTCLIGEQQFIMDKTSTASPSEAVIYLKVKNPSALDSTVQAAGNFLKTRFPECIMQAGDADNIFNTIFSSSEKPLTARLRATTDNNSDRTKNLRHILAKIQTVLPDQPIGEILLSDYTVLHTDPARLMLYDVEFSAVYNKLKNAFNENQVFLITDNQDFVPVILGGKLQTIQTILGGLFIRNTKGELIPVRNLISQSGQEDLKTIVAGKEGEYYPVDLDIPEEKLADTENSIRQAVAGDKLFEVSFSGSILSNKKLMRELVFILMISLALLYFILASQFESLILPLIVLIEVPIDIFGAFLALKLGGSGINLMSLIGIVVMSGVVINDSILKIDTMNQLRAQGYSLIRSMVEAGHRRLTAILMTSLTTILALAPLLFSSGLGADLQRPLALSMIGGMTLGTLVSLYLVPLCYYYLRKGGKNVPQ